jgi:hypothetical protein
LRCLEFLTNCWGETLKKTDSFAIFQTEEWLQRNEELTAQVAEPEEKYKKKLCSCFEWRYEFPEVLDDDGNYIGFDVVIGNPPYIQLQSMGSMTDAYKNMNYKVFERTGDIYCLFYERGYRLLKPQGHLCFITSNKWIRAGYGESTKRFSWKNVSCTRWLSAFYRVYF